MPELTRLSEPDRYCLAKRKECEATYKINLERYSKGDLTNLDMNLYQNQLRAKKMAYAQALIDYKNELLNLKIRSL